MSDPTSTHPPVTVIGYGSLMSGLGLARLGRLPVTDVARVRVLGCRRGFGKLSQYGDRFAMVLEPLAWNQPIRGEPLTSESAIGGAVEALALTVGLPDLARIAAREGYHADTLVGLAEAARRAARTLPEHLWAIFESEGFDCRGYRRALYERTGYTSPHYIPHPIAMAGTGPAVVFLPPGAEGSGSDGVVPIRVQSAMTRVLTLRQVWSIKPNTSQLDYIAMSVLGETHNISLADLIADLEDYPPLVSLLRTRLANDLPVERERFMTALALDGDTYAARFLSGPRRASFLREGP